MATDEGRYWWRRSLAPHTAGKVNVGRIERVVSAAAGVGMLSAATARRGPGRPVLAVLGTLATLRAATGHSRVYEAAGLTSADLGEGAGVTVDENVTIMAPAEEVFRRWADLTQLPRYLAHVREVTDVSPGVTHWVVEGPLGREWEFDAEIIDRREGEFLAWRTRPGQQLEHAGSVRVREVPGRGTELQLKMRYLPGPGVAGFAAARALHALADREIAEELRRFKAILEAGEAPTTEGQPSGRAKERPPVVATGPVKARTEPRAPVMEV